MYQGVFKLREILLSLTQKDLPSCGLGSPLGKGCQLNTGSWWKCPN
uniref:Uncharacterized protein n=1 Tax=Trichinella nativa TaxID=6335 RepID=A0A0V1KJP2_9BILA